MRGPQVTSPLLKIEDENYAKDNPTKRVQLFGLGLAAKRYVLFERRPNGQVMIRKRSDHGLGVYLDPTDPRPRTERPADPDPNVGWVAEVWRRLIHRALGRKERPTDEWWSRPAMIQFTASSPDRLKPYHRRERLKAYGDRLKPFNFMLAANVHPSGVAPPLDRDRCRLIAPFERDAGRWLALEWRDLYSGLTCRLAATGAAAPGLAIAESIASMVDAYWQHPEAKSCAPDGTPCEPDTVGLLARRAVRVVKVRPIGKETNRLVEMEEGTGGDPEDSLLTYRVASENPDADQEYVTALRQLTTADLQQVARRLGIAERSLWRYRSGKPVSPRHHRILCRWYHWRSR